MQQKSRSAVWFLLWLISTPLVHPQDQGGPKHSSVCNQDSTLCVEPTMEQSVVQNPFYFEVQVRCPAQISLTWELRDDSGTLLDQDLNGDLVFLVHRTSSSQRTLAVRDFAMGPAKTGHGKLILHATTYSVNGENHPLPELSIPLRLATGTTSVTYAIPGDGFKQAVIDNVESDPAHRIPIRADLSWRTTTLLHVEPAMLGGAAAEAAARSYPGQVSWHVVSYSNAQDTAHLVIHGGGWAGVTYYLTGLTYLLEKTVEQQTGARRVVFDQPPDFGR